MHSLEIFWNEVLEKDTELEAEKPVLPNTRKRQTKLTFSEHFYDQTSEHFSSRHYFEIVYKLTNKVERRFEGVVLHTKIEIIIVSAADGQLLDIHKIS